MKKLLLFHLLFFFCWSTYSQTLYDDYDKYFSYNINLSDVDIDHLLRFGFQDSFKFNDDDYQKYKDSREILSKIENVTIEIKNPKSLDSVIDLLQKFENLKFLKLKRGNIFLTKKFEKPDFPKNLGSLKNLEVISIPFYKEWNANTIFFELSKIENLKYLGMKNVPEDVFLNENFKLLKNIKGLYIQSSKGPLLPDFINQFRNLEALILGIGHYPDFQTHFTKLAQLDNLKDLYFWGNVKNEDLKGFLAFKNIERLTLRSFEFADSNLVFESLKNNNLQELVLLNNKLEIIPKNIYYFKSLETFYSSNNKFKELPKAFYELRNLKKVSISGSELKNVDESINNLAELDTLYLYYNSISQLPSSMDGLKSLKLLSLSNNDIVKLPDDIISLEKLERLLLSNNKISVLPDNFGNLTNLKHLDVANNYIKVLPKDFGNLKSLEFFRGSNNQVKFLPKSFSNLTNLNKLVFDKNDLALLPSDFGKLNKLKELNLNFNFLKELPKSISKLSELEQLHLQNNGLENLPKNLGRLTNLKTLILKNWDREVKFQKYNHKVKGGFVEDTINRKPRLKNNIGKIPKTLYSLSNLKRLDFSGNHSLNFQELFNQLIKSEAENYILNVNHCSIQKLPDNGWENIKAKSLNLSNNSIQSLPKNLINAVHINSLNLSKNANKNLYSVNSKEQMMLLLESQGIITENDFPKTKEMAVAYAKVANKNYRRKNYKKALNYMERAIALDSSSLRKNFSEDNIIKSYFETGNYKRTIELADIEIQKDTTGKGMRVLNFILPNFDYKAKSHLKLGDTLGAINTFVAVSKEFPSYNQWTKAGMLSKHIGNTEKAKEYFEESFKQFNKNIDFNSENWGDHLSLLEAYIIAEDYDKANDYISKLNKSTIYADINYDALLTYFEIIMDNIIGSKTVDYEEKLKMLRQRINNESISLKRWSFQLFLDWNAMNQLNKTQKQRIRDLSSAFMY